MRKWPLPVLCTQHMLAYYCALSLAYCQNAREQWSVAQCIVSTHFLSPSHMIASAHKSLCPSHPTDMHARSTDTNRLPDQRPTQSWASLSMCYTPSARTSLDSCNHTQHSLVPPFFYFRMLLRWQLAAMHNLGLLGQNLRLVTGYDAASWAW